MYKIDKEMSKKQHTFNKEYFRVSMLSKLCYRIDPSKFEIYMTVLTCLN